MAFHVKVTMAAFFIIMGSILVLGLLLFAIFVLLNFQAQKYVEIHEQYIEHGSLR